jgi:urease accessory protein
MSLHAPVVRAALDGLLHPVLGLHHLAFILMVGLLAAPFARHGLLCASFVIATLVGCLLHLAAVPLPWIEGVIAASVILIGALVGRGRKLPAWLVAGLFLAAGLFHGFAYGESMVGAERAAVGAYLVAVSCSQLLIAQLVGLLARRIRPDKGWVLPPLARFSGVAAVAFGFSLML